MEDFVHFLRKDTHRVLVYRGDEEDILGLMLLALRPAGHAKAEKYGAHLKLSLLAVASAARGRRVGTRMLEACVRIAADNGVKVVLDCIVPYAEYAANPLPARTISQFRRGVRPILKNPPSADALTENAYGRVAGGPQSWYRRLGFRSNVDNNLALLKMGLRTSYEITNDREESLRVYEVPDRSPLFLEFTRMWIYPKDFVYTVPQMPVKAAKAVSAPTLAPQTKETRPTTRTMVTRTMVAKTITKTTCPPSTRTSVPSRPVITRTSVPSRKSNAIASKIPTRTSTYKPAKATISKPIVTTKTSKPIMTTKTSKPIMTTKTSKLIMKTKTTRPITTKTSKPIMTTKTSKP